MKDLIFSFIFTLLLIPVFIFSQEDTTGNNLENQGPYVSKLKAQAEDALILLTWENPENFEGTILVYRYTTQISNSNILLASEIAQLKSTKLSYVDFPQNSLEYYYAVLLKNKENEIHYNFIPYRNITSTAASITAQNEKENTAAVISQIKAQVINDSIKVSWNTSQKKRDLLIFRSTKTIRTARDLLESVSPQTLEGGTNSYTDSAISGIEYYYAVLDSDQFKIGDITIKPNENSTTKAVTIPIQESATSHEKFISQRTRPLPLLSITKDVEFDQYLITSPTVLLPRKTELSQKTKSAIKKIVKSIPSPAEPQMEFTILEIDKVNKSSGEAYTLHNIVSKNLNFTGMDRVLEELTNFLIIKHSLEVDNRASFYLGQVYYFKADYQKAILNFIQAHDYYYIETQDWMDACFYQLMNQEEQ